MVDSLLGAGYTDRFVWTVVQLYSYWSLETGLERGARVRIQLYRRVLDRG